MGGIDPTRLINGNFISCVFFLAFVTRRVKHFSLLEKKKKKKWKNSRRTFPDEFIAHTLQRTDEKKEKKKEIKNTAGEKIKILFVCPLSVLKFLTLISQIFNLSHNFR